jgi:hypothetical protein
MRKSYLSQAAFGKILQDHRRLSACIFRVKIADVGPVKGAQKGCLSLVSNFIEGNKNFGLIFTTARHPKYFKPIANIQKATS